MPIAPQVNLETYTTREYTCRLTLPSIAYGYLTTSDAGGAITTGAGSHTIQFVGTRAQVNTAMDNTVYVPGADVIISPFNLTYLQSDDNGNGTPGSNVVNGTMEITIRDTHNEHSYNTGAQTYDEDVQHVWDLGSITDLRPDNIDSNIQYTLTITLDDTTAGIFTNWTLGAPGVFTFTSTKVNCNTELATIEFVPAPDYVGSFGFTLQQQQTTDGIDQGTTASVEFTVNTVHAEHSITASQTYITDTTATWDVGSITDLRPDNIDANIQYTMTATDVRGTLTNWSANRNFDAVSTPGTGENGYLGGSMEFSTLGAISGDGTTQLLSGFAGPGTSTGTVVVRSLAVGPTTITTEQYLIKSITEPRSWNGFGRSLSLSQDGNTAIVGDDGFARYTTKTGTVSRTSGTNTLVGVGTLFTTELSIGNAIEIDADGSKRTIDTITNDTNLTVSVSWSSTSSGSSYEHFEMDVGAATVFTRTSTNTVLTGSINPSPAVSITGTVAKTSSNQITGTGTLFTTETSEGDLLVYNGETSEIRSVQSDTSLLMWEDYTTSTTDATPELLERSVVGVGTLFTSELQLGQPLLVNGETKIVISITDDTNLTVHSAFTDTANDTSPEIAAPYWTEQQDLTRSVIRESDHFGMKVELSSDGDTAIVLAGNGFYDDDLYVFTRSGTVWTEEQRINKVGRRYGLDCSIGNDTLAIGDYRKSTTTGLTGSIVDIVDGTVTGSGTLFTTELAIGDWILINNFYNQVSTITNNTTLDLVSFWFDDDLGDASPQKVTTLNHGEIEIYTRSGTVWSLESTLSHTLRELDHFGKTVSLSIDGNTLVTQVSDTPGAYVYTRSGTTWTHDHTIPTTDIGVDMAGGGTYFMAGIDVYRLASGTWSKLATLPLTPSSYENPSIADDGHRIVVEGSFVLDLETFTNTFTDTKANCNTELATVEFVPEPGYNGAFTITYAQNQDTDSVDQGSDTISVTPLTSNATYAAPIGGINITAPQPENVDIGTITDPDDDGTKTYTLRLTHAYGPAAEYIGGGWNAGTSTLTVTGTLAYINALTPTLNPLGDPGNYTDVTGVLDDDTFGLTAVSTDTYTITLI